MKFNRFLLVRFVFCLFCLFAPQMLLVIVAAVAGMWHVAYARIINSSP